MIFTSKRINLQINFRKILTIDKYFQELTRKEKILKKYFN